MLSPALHHRSVPKREAANLHFRRRLLRAAEKSRRTRELLLRACKDDCVFYVGAFGFQYNPDHVGSEVGPFIPWDFQADALIRTIYRLYTARKDVNWPKSRKVGATWLALFKDDWLCLFHDRKKTLAVSHTEAAVDKAGDPDSLFWKTAFIHEHLPHWMLRGTKKKKLAFAYPATKSVQTGTASTGRSGVGGRASSVFSDETAKQQNAAEIIGQTRDTGPRLFVSTNYGITEFSRLCERPDAFNITMHWSQCPEFARGLYRSNPEAPNGYEILDTTYDFPPDYRFVTDGRPFGGPFPGIRSPWYDTECAERASARDVAMHLDIDVSGSGWQFYDAGMIRRLELQFCRDPVWEGDVELDYSTGVAKQLVPQKGGPLRLWINPQGDLEMPEGRYGGGCDIAQGTGATPSVFSLGNASLKLKVLEYADAHINPERFAAKVAALGRLFRDQFNRPALIAWEAAGSVGVVFAKSFFATGYRRVYYPDFPMGLDGVREPTTKPGWNPGAHGARGLLHREHRAALSNHRFTNPSAQALRQLLEFEYVNGGEDVRHPGEASGDNPVEGRENHGDFGVADALCFRMLQILGGAKAPTPDKPKVVPGSWEWRREMGEAQDRERETAWS